MVIEELILRQYGDLLLDFFSSVLWSRLEGRKMVRQVLRVIHKRSSSGELPERYQRAWVLQCACILLKRDAPKLARRISPPEQAMLDVNPDPVARLAQMESFFHLLHLDEQMVLLLRDKYGLPYPEIATATQMPENSLKVLRQQGLDALERSIWGHSARSGLARSTVS